MLLQLELKNFKKHHHLVVDFTAGLNGIIGPNYTGKSTLLNGIMFCLGGSRLVPGKRLQTRDTNSGFGANLTWRQGGRMFHVERGKTTAHLYEAPEGTQWPSDPTQWQRTASGTSPVNNAIARLLGMPLKRFAQIKYARQKQAEALLRAGSTELFKIISELTGLEKVSDALAELGVEVNAQNKFLVGLEYVDPADLQARIEALQGVAQRTKTLELAAVEIATHQHEAAQEARNNAKTLSDAAQALRMVKRKRATLESELVEARASETEKAGEVKKLQAAAVAPQAVLDLKSRRDAALTEKVRVQGLLQRKTAVEAAVAAAGAALPSDEGRAALEAAAAKASAAAAEYPEGLVESWEAGLHTASASLMATATRLAETKKAAESGVCSACKRPLDDAHDPAHYAQEVAALTQQQAELYQTAASLKESLSAASSALKSAETAAKALAGFDALVEAAQVKLAAKQEELASISAQLPDISVADLSQEEARLAAAIELAETNARALARKLAEHAALVRDVERLTAEHSALAPSILGAEKSEEQLEAEAEAETLRASECAELARCARVEAQQLGEAYEQERSQKNKAEGELAVVLDRNQRFTEASQKLALLTELQTYIRNNRDRYTAQVWEMFTASASMFVSSATGGRISEVTRSAEGEFGFSEDGFEMELAEASGAQSAIMGLAVQLALADAAPSPLDIILLDEPSADCDAEHSAAAMALLAASGRQVIAVTHREFDAALFSNTIQLGGDREH